MKSIITLLRSLFWRFYLRLRGAKVGRRLRVGGKLDILLRDGATHRNITLGDDVTFDGRAYIRIRKKGRLLIRHHVRIGTEAWLVAANDHDFEVGHHTVLGSYSIFNGGHGLRIGPYVLFAAYVYVNTSDHGLEQGTCIQKQPFVGAPIIIGEDVWIGGHVFINKGVTLHDGCVIGAGAVVTRDIPANAIAAGVPAEVVKERPKPSMNKETEAT